MGHDLREEELRGDARVEQMADLGVWIRVRVRPSSERQAVLVTSNPFAQLPRVLDAPRWSDMPIAAEDHERLETVLPRAIRRTPGRTFVCLHVRNGTTCDRGTSVPRLVTR